MAQVSFRIDDTIKTKAEKACADMGLSMSAAFTIFAKKVGRERRIPFEITADSFYDERNMRYLERIAKEIRSGEAHFSEHKLIED